MAGISVVIRTRDSSRTLGQVLDMLRLEGSDELIVVDSGSSDSTLTIAQAFGARILRVERPFNYSTSLNRGFEMAQNEWVLVLSSHTIPTNDRFMNAIREFAVSAPDDVVVGFGSRVFKHKLGESTDSANGFQRMPKTNFQWGAGNTMAVYRKSVWIKHHFRPDIKTAEDLEWFVWALERGYAGATIDGAVGIYRNQGSCTHMFMKGWREARQARLLLSQKRKPLLRTLFEMGIGMAYFLKLWARGDLSFASMARQQSHHVGGCLSSLMSH
jgi:glycosyltransferase involved in cell wall biosynthesis